MGQASASARLHWRWPALASAAVLAIFLFNLSIAIPVAISLKNDERNSGISLVGYRAFGLSPTAITLDLWSIGEDKAPVDLFRSLFQTAEALKNRRFSRVVLSRSGRAMYVLAGEDFTELGRDYGAGENPVYLIRTLPEKLHRPDGSAAFGSWTGGWLGVLTHQMEDVNSFAASWVGGKESLPTADSNAPP